MAAARTSPCDACDGRCCRTYLVQLTGDDAWRIAAGLDLDLREVVAFRPQPVPDAGGFLLEPGGSRHELALRRTAALDGREGCAFLRDAGDGRARCSIYRLRPRACRRFPAAWREWAASPGERARVRGGACVTVSEGIACAPGAWSARDLARARWRAELAREADEVALHAEVVAVWNARIVAEGGARTAEQFVEHLADAYGFVARLRSALRPRERRGPAFLEGVRETLGALPAR